MGDNHPERLHLRTDFELVAKVVFSSLRPWKSWGKVECRRAMSTASGASKRFPRLFGMWTGHGTSGQIRPPASMDRQILSSFCGSML
jgi:hypothetical protein